MKKFYLVIVMIATLAVGNSQAQAMMGVVIGGMAAVMGVMGLMTAGGMMGSGAMAGGTGATMGVGTMAGSAGAMAGGGMSGVPVRWREGTS